MVILEAMMAGLPVVATKVGGVPSAVGENGLLVEPGHPAQLAEAMERILSDEGLRIDLARAGQAHCQVNYGVDRMVSDYLSWYKKILGNA